MVATRIISELMRMGTKLGITLNAHANMPQTPSQSARPHTPRGGLTTGSHGPQGASPLEAARIDDVAATALAASSGNPAVAVMDLLHRVVKRKLASLRALRAAAAASQAAGAPAPNSVATAVPPSPAATPRYMLSHQRHMSWGGAAPSQLWLEGAQEAQHQLGFVELEADAMAVLRHSRSMGGATACKAAATALQGCCLISTPAPPVPPPSRTISMSPGSYTPPQEHTYQLPARSPSQEHEAGQAGYPAAGSPSPESSSGPARSDNTSSGRLKRRSSGVMDPLLAATWPPASRPGMGLTAREILGTSGGMDAWAGYGLPATPGAIWLRGNEMFYVGVGRQGGFAVCMRAPCHAGQHSSGVRLLKGSPGIAFVGWLGLVCMKGTAAFGWLCRALCCCST